MRKPKWIRVALGLLAAYLLASIAGGISLTEMALHPQRRLSTDDDDARARRIATDAGSRFVLTSIVARDGAELRASLFTPRREQINGDAVMVLHGVSDSRAGVYGLSEFLLRHGYVVLVPDSRAHGESRGDIATYGVLEAEDINEWARFLMSAGLDSQMAPPQSRPCIYAVGGSMGRAIALQALGTNATLCGVVAEAPFADFREIAFDRAGGVFGAGDWLGRSLFRAPIEAGLLYARWRYGVDLRLASPLHVVRSSTTPILLIHGESDRNNPIRHSKLLQAANPQIELWAVPNMDHTSASGVDGPQFQRRVLELFAQSRNRRPSTADAAKQAAP